MSADQPNANTHLYCLTIKGPVDESFVSAYCPAGTTLAQQAGASCLSNIRTDQSGIVGLVRHLHNLGCTLLALTTDKAEEDGSHDGDDTLDTP